MFIAIATTAVVVVVMIVIVIVVFLLDHVTFFVAGVVHRCSCGFLIRRLSLLFLLVLLENLSKDGARVEEALLLGRGLAR